MASQRQIQVRLAGIEKAQAKLQNMSPEERSQIQPSPPAQNHARRENIRASQEKWKSMSHEERQRFMPRGPI
jgi:hypothetical protein